MARRRANQEGIHEREEQLSANAMNGWMQSQIQLFDHFDEVASRWLDRRREALDATRQTIEQMRQSRDASEDQEWVLGSMRRLSQDFAELRQAALGFAHTAPDRFGRTVEGSVREGEAAQREALSAAGSKPSPSGRLRACPKAKRLRLLRS